MMIIGGKRNQENGGGVQRRHATKVSQKILFHSPVSLLLFPYSCIESGWLPIIWNWLFGSCFILTGIQLGARVWIAKSMLLKMEYVMQRYNDFNVSDLQYNPGFSGVVTEVSVAF